MINPKNGLFIQTWISMILLGIVHTILIVLSLSTLSMIHSDGQDSIGAVIVALLNILMLISSSIILILVLIFGFMGYRYQLKKDKTKGLFDSINIFQLIISIISSSVSITFFIVVDRYSQDTWSNMLYGFSLAFSVTLLITTFQQNQQLKKSL
jgi:uncharacterized membrane protein